MVRTLRPGLHLHFDGASGAAGDMVLAALIDAGVPEAVIRDALDRAGVGGERLLLAEVVKAGMRALDVRVAVGASPDAGSHHAHRHYRGIRAALSASPLGDGVKRWALAIFDRIARAEATLHATDLDRVAFHEVGAIDSIVDVVGVAAALDWLAPVAVTAASVAVGHGSLTGAHGRLPVPSPAALEILRPVGAVIEDGGVAAELCTPTGAAILAAAVTQWSPMPAMVPVAIGYGAGDMDLPDRPNVLRVVLGEANPEGRHDSAYRVEANLDDMNPEMCEHVAAKLFDAGAVDVWWTPIVMKRSRPALQLSALVPEAAAEAVLRAVVRETTSIGVRFDRVARRVLDRETEIVATPFGELPVKIAFLDGEVVNAAPEYEACRQAALRHQAPLKQVFAAALAAYDRHRRGHT